MIKFSLPQHSIAPTAGSLLHPVYQEGAAGSVIFWMLVIMAIILGAGLVIYFLYIRYTTERDRLEARALIEARRRASQKPRVPPVPPTYDSYQPYSSYREPAYPRAPARYEPPVEEMAAPGAGASYDRELSMIDRILHEEDRRILQEEKMEPDLGAGEQEVDFIDEGPGEIEVLEMSHGPAPAREEEPLASVLGAGESPPTATAGRPAWREGRPAFTEPLKEPSVPRPVAPPPEEPRGERDFIQGPLALVLLQKDIERTVSKKGPQPSIPPTPRSGRPEVRPPPPAPSEAVDMGALTAQLRSLQEKKREEARRAEEARAREERRRREEEARAEAARAPSRAHAAEAEIPVVRSAEVARREEEKRRMEEERRREERRRRWEEIQRKHEAETVDDVLKRIGIR